MNVRHAGAVYPLGNDKPAYLAQDGRFMGDSICRPSVDFTRASSLVLEEQARHIGGFLSGALKTIR